MNLRTHFCWVCGPGLGVGPSARPTCSWEDLRSAPEGWLGRITQDPFKCQVLREPLPDPPTSVHPPGRPVPASPRRALGALGACVRLSSKSPLPSSPHFLNNYQGPTPVTQPRGKAKPPSSHIPDPGGGREILSQWGMCLKCSEHSAGVEREGPWGEGEEEPGGQCGRSEGREGTGGSEVRGGLAGDVGPARVGSCPREWGGPEPRPALHRRVSSD